jgi:hypothetical protein
MTRLEGSFWLGIRFLAPFVQFFVLPEQASDVRAQVAD